MVASAPPPKTPPWEINGNAVRTAAGARDGRPTVVQRPSNDLPTPVRWPSDMARPIAIRLSLDGSISKNVQKCFARATNICTYIKCFYVQKQIVCTYKKVLYVQKSFVRPKTFLYGSVEVPSKKGQAISLIKVRILQRRCEEVLRLLLKGANVTS